MRDIKQMTVSEALAAGYERCGLNRGDAWQTLFQISDLCDGDWERGEWVLADKQEQYVSIDAESIEDFLLDYLRDQESQTGSDVDFTGDAMKGFDYEKIATEVNKRMMASPYYLLTKIVLIKDTTDNRSDTTNSNQGTES